MYMILFFKENPIIVDLGAWKPYKQYQNTKYFPALVKEDVILDVQLNPLDVL